MVVKTARCFLNDDRSSVLTKKNVIVNLDLDFSSDFSAIFIKRLTDIFKIAKATTVMPPVRRARNFYREKRAERGELDPARGPIKFIADLKNSQQDRRFSKLDLFSLDFSI